MARFESDDPGAREPWQEAFWARWIEMALHSRRGLDRLLLLEEALLAIPDKRLLKNGVSDGEKVCAIGAVGALVRMRDPYGMTWAKAVQELQGESGEYEEGWVLENAPGFGFSRTFAIEVAFTNDIWDTTDDAERYTLMLDWVRGHIRIAMKRLGLQQEQPT